MLGIEATVAAMVMRTGTVRAVPERTEDARQGLDVRRRAAFERLWERERPRVWRLTARLSGCPDAADDLTQEVGLRALAAYGNFRGAAAESTWLFRIAVNAAIRWREQSRTAQRHTVITNGVPDMAGPLESSPERQAMQAEATARLHRALDVLPEELRTPLLLHAWESMKYREIATLLEIPMGTVMSRLNAARTRLRRELSDEGDGGDAM
jgi:RNA polymerase sigma-70 factor, ECF subfamily